ncbi:hypothetical protein [Sphingomonas beigongshangi]|uniref:hypothetical protein n=1 Tax=Sphingomonas beigongshangi TaxID=2782540 RepID=UPI001AEEA0CC|nr:hypothetical protein [Sphingomonas beigongshangi]
MPNIPTACAAAVTAPGLGGRQLWRSRAQLSKAELACYYELHRATRAGLDRAVTALRTHYNLDPAKAAGALAGAQCALLVGAGDLMLFERGQATIGLITPRLASDLGTRILALQRAQVAPGNILRYSKYAFDTMGALHGLQAPRPGRLC